MKTLAPQSPVETLYRAGRKTFIERVPDGGARLDALFHTAPALGELAVGVVYGYLHERPGLDPRLQEAAIFCRDRRRRYGRPAVERAFQDQPGPRPGAWGAD